MSFVTPENLSRLGLTPDLLGADDESGLDLMLGFINLASYRLQKWVGDEFYREALTWRADNPARPRMVMAELYLTICEILPVVWMQSQSSEKSVSIEGFRVDLATPNETERSAILTTLLNRAERLVEEWLGPDGTRAGVIQV